MEPNEYLFFVFLPCLAFLIYCRFLEYKIQRTFSTLESRTVSGGAHAVKIFLDHCQLFDIQVEKNLAAERSDYEIGQKRIILSSYDYQSASLTAVARALCQAGYAIQHMQGNSLCYFKKIFAGFLNKVGAVSLFLIFLGLWEPFRFLYSKGILLFNAYMLISLVLFSFERYNARCVYAQLIQSEIFPMDELKLIRRVFESFSFGTMSALFLELPFFKSKRSASLRTHH